MRAAVLYEVGKKLEIKDLNIDKPKDGEVLIDMKAAGVCASDHHVIHGQIPYPTPIVLGHENAGIVEEIGKNVNGIKVGDSCIMSFVSSCGKCVYCRTGLANHCSRHFSDPKVQHKLFGDTSRIHDEQDNGIFQMNKLGGFAEKQVVPADSLLVIPKEEKQTMGELSDESAAALGRVLPRLCRAVCAATGATEYNLLQKNGSNAHQAVMHVHIHIIPRLADGGLAIGWVPGNLGEDGPALAEAISEKIADESTT